MEFPATQAMDDDFPATQAVEASQVPNEKILIGTLCINGKTHQIFTGTTTIGRHPGCHIFIDDQTVSKFHAEIEVQSYNGTIFIRDLKSSNKTRINNSKLRPECNYQLKNGDEVRFGTVAANLNIIGSIDDSFVSSTPKLNIKRNNIVIPGTPDTSMNENSLNLDDTDDSVIQATQPGKLTSREVTNKCTINLDQDTSSNVINADNVSFKDDQDDSIYSAETQKSRDVGMHNESDENIFEMETQVHSDMNDQEKQQIDTRKMNISKNVSNDVSIYSADTQQILNRSNDSPNFHKTKTFDASIYSAETQKYKIDESEVKKQCFTDAAVDVLNESMNEAETQQFNNEVCQVSDEETNSKTDKFEDFFYEAETQKFDQNKLCELENNSEPNKNNFMKQFEDSNDDIETQKFHDCSSAQKMLNKTKTDSNTEAFTLDKSCNQKFQDGNINPNHSLNEEETQPFSTKELRESKNSSTTQNILEEAETQKFDHEKPHVFLTPNSLKIRNKRSSLNQARESINDIKTQEFCENILTEKSLDEEETQPFSTTELSEYKNSSTIQNLLEEAETQKFDHDIPCEFLTPKSLKPQQKRSSLNQAKESINDMETQEFCVHEMTKSLHVENDNTLQFIQESLDKQKNNEKSLFKEVTRNDSLNEVKTQPFSKEDLSKNKNSLSINISLEESETQKFIPSKPCEFQIPESLSESIKKSSSHQARESINDMETQELCENILTEKSSDEEENQPFTKENLSKCHNSPSVQNSLEDAETQKLYLTPKSLNKQQKVSRSIQARESINDMETQEFCITNVTKRVLDEEETQPFTKENLSKCQNSPSVQNSLEDAETQKLYLTPKSSNKQQKVSHSNQARESIHNMETQEFCITNVTKRVLDEEETQPFTKENLSKCQNSPSVQNSLEDAETQKLYLTPKSSNKQQKVSHSNQARESIHNMETQEFCITNVTKKVLDEEETQPFTKENLSKCHNSPSVQNSLEDAETQKLYLTPKSLNKQQKVSHSNHTRESIHNMETQEFCITNVTKKVLDEEENAIVKVTHQDNTIGEEETQLFDKKEFSKCQSLSTIRNSLQEAETQEYEKVYSKGINRSSNNKSIHNKLEDSSSKLAPSPAKDIRKQLNSSKNISLGSRLKNVSSVSNKKDFEQINDNELDLFSENEEDIFASCETETKESKTLESSKTSSAILRSNKSSLGRSSSFIYQRSPSPESDDNIFDDDYEEKMNSKRSLVNVPNASIVKAEALVKSSVTITNAVLSNTIDDDIDEIGPTQPVNTSTFDTEDIHLAATQIVTPQAVKKYVPSSTVNQEDDSLAPTQLIYSEKYHSPEKVDFDEIDLPCTLKISTQQLDEDLALSPNTSRQPSHLCGENTSINDVKRDLSFAVTKNEMKTPVTNVSRSKRCSNQLEVSPRKRFRQSSCDSDSKEKALQNMEENLEKIFEGDAEEELTVAKSMLQTQQLKNILESSQLEDSCQEYSSKIKSSPTLGKNFGSKKCKDFHQPTSHSFLSKSKTSSANLNDTIERNLFEMFENNSNDVLPHQPEMLMTQQLTDVLESQTEQSVEEQKSELTTTDEKSKKSSESESSKAENQICHRRGTIGFDLDLNCVKSKKRVAVCSLITSDSQSDNEATANIEVNSTPSRKRLSLSLPKNVNLNASVRSEPGTSNSNNSPKIRNSATKKRHVLSRGTRGFNLDLQAIESETLVSADSTENEDDKVGSNRIKSNFMGGSQIKNKIASESSDSDDLLNDLPDVKIAGTKDCPATSSQLAAPSDDDEDEIDTFEPIKLPLKWRWYAEKRYDLIYKNLEKPTDTKPESRPPSEPKTLSVDDILANLGPSVTDETKKASSRRMRRSSNCTLTARNKSPQTLVTNNPDTTFQQVDTDSDGSSDEMFPEYKPLPEAKFLGRRATFNQLESKLNDKNLDDSDDEDFNLLRQRCRELLKKPQVFATKKLSSTLQTAKNSSSTRTRSSHRRRKCASDNYQLNSNSTELDNTDNNDEDHSNFVGDGQGKQVPSENTIASKDTFVFQVPNGSLVPANVPERKLATVPTTTKVINNEKQSTKRRTRQEENGKGIPKLPKVSVLISPLREKFLTNKINRQLLLSANTVPMFKQKDVVPKDDQKFVPTIRVTRRDFIPDPPSFVEKSSKTKDKANKSSKENVKLDANIRNNSRASKINKSFQTKRNKKSDKNDTIDVKNSKSPQTPRNQKSIPEVAKSISNNLIDDSDSSDEFEELRLVKMNSLKQENSFNKHQESVNDPKNANRSIVSSNVSNKKVIKTNDSKEMKVLLNKVKNLKKTELKTGKNDGNTKMELQNSKIISDNTSSRNSKRKKVINYSTDDQDNSDQGIRNKNYNTRNTKSSSISNSITSPIAIRKSKRIKNNLKTQNSEIDEGQLDSMSSTATILTSPDRSLKTKVSSTSKNIRSKRKKSLNESVQSFNDDDLQEKSTSNTVLSVSSSKVRKNDNARLIATSDHISIESQEVAEIMQNYTESSSENEKHDQMDLEMQEKPVGRRTRIKTHALTKQTRNQVKKNEIDLPLTDSVRSTRYQKRKISNSSPPVSPKRNKLLKNQQLRLTDSTIAFKVLFIGEISVHYREIVPQLGGKEVDNISNCSVVVCEKVQKDFKFLYSLSRGISIVSLKWLDASNKAKLFVNCDDYILKDQDAESNYRFNLNDSIERARKIKLLQDYTVLIAPRLKTISVPELKELVITNGGKALVRAPKNWDRKLVIIGEESDLDGMLKFMDKAPNTVTVHSIEFILTGILRQKLSLTEFKLSL